MPVTAISQPTRRKPYNKPAWVSPEPEATKISSGCVSSAARLFDEFFCCHDIAQRTKGRMIRAQADYIRDLAVLFQAIGDFFKLVVGANLVIASRMLV